MARVAAAVTVVTTNGPAGPAGLTASAVTSVTDKPPTLLACVNRAGASHPVILANGVFAVNVLAADQQAVAAAFARKGHVAADLFASGPWRALGSGAPGLEGALVVFDCRLSARQDIGTHSVLFGEILGARFGEDRAPLLYARRGYATLGARLEG